MALTKSDLLAIKTLIHSETEKTINKSLDKRMGPHLENLRLLIKTTIDEDETLVRQKDIKYLPTTDLFLSKMDELMGEVKTSREEQTMLSGRVTIHSDQLERIEKYIGLPAFASEY